MAYDYSIHSDILVHWTGKDLEPDPQDENHWSDPKRKRTDGDCARKYQYVQRLRDILQHGLWMTDQTFEPESSSSLAKLDVPPTPCTCFTELKLSESRRHAAEYGRLGIGVKRPFLLKRGGRPVAYYGYDTVSDEDYFLQSCARDLTDKRLMHFFKPMCTPGRPLSYEYYSESEWRIVFHENLKQSAKAIKPSTPGNDMRDAYLATLSEDQRRKLRYLLPLDGWLAIIIYPSVDIKNLAQRDIHIRRLIRNLKKVKDHANDVEKGNLPVELDLDLCKEF